MTSAEDCSKFWASLIRMRILTQMYVRLVLSDKRWKRAVGLSILSLLYLMRTHKQFDSRQMRLLLLLALGATQAAALTGPWQVTVTLIGLLLLAAATALVMVAGSQADDGIGHRGGALRYTGPLCENTIEAAVALLERDRHEWPLPNFPYLEFDVQETADGELVLFHDATLADAFPRNGTNSAHAEQLEKQKGIPLNLLTVQDLSLAQLQALHLAGRPGLRVPTLEQYIDACVAAGLRRTLAIEVKKLKSDAGRQRLINTISNYLRDHGPRLDQDAEALQQRCSHLGWAGVIAFPHLFSLAVGDFGSSEWRRWAREFKQRGIPVRACHALWLTLVG